MNILLLMPQLPYPAHAGATLRNFHIIKGLAQNHTVSLLTFVEQPDVEFGPLVDLCEEIVTIEAPERTLSQRLYQLLTTRQPDMAQRLWDFGYNVALDNLLAETAFDIVQIEGIELAYTIETIRELSPNSKIVFDNHNAEAALQQSALETDLRQPKRWPAAAYSAIQVGRLQKFEQWACSEADAVTVVSQADADLLAEQVEGDQSFTVIPNCIDIQAYQDSSESITYDAVFVGKMDYRPNIDAALWFVDEIWPQVLKKIPSATCAIVGQKPHQRLERLESEISVTITGRVETVLPYLHGAHVLVMPLRMGSGTRLKLIEALAVGKRVVSTTIGAAGFDVESGVHLTIADDAAAFAKAVVAAIHDNAQAPSPNEHALEFAKQYDWRVVIPKFEAVYAEIVQQGATHDNV